MWKMEKLTNKRTGNPNDDDGDRDHTTFTNTGSVGRDQIHFGGQPNNQSQVTLS